MLLDYFESNKDRQAQATAYAIGHNAQVDANNNSPWWLDTVNVVWEKGNTNEKLQKIEYKWNFIR